MNDFASTAWLLVLIIGPLLIAIAAIHGLFHRRSPRVAPQSEGRDRGGIVPSGEERSRFIQRAALACAVLLALATFALPPLLRKTTSILSSEVHRCGEAHRGTPTVKLSDEECALIARTVSQSGAPKSTPFQWGKDVKVGQDVPSEVTAQDLPPDVTKAHPDLVGYKYVRVADDVALVDPKTTKVVAFVALDVGPKKAPPGRD